MITPVITIRNSGSTHQKPRTLCQFQSRARPQGPPRNSVIFFRLFQFHSFGHHRNGPVITRMRKAEIARSGDRAPRGPAPAADPEPAMHIFNGGEKSPQFSRSLAENLSGVRIYEDGPLAAEIECHRRGRIRSHGDGRGRSSLRLLHRCQQRRPAAGAAPGCRLCPKTAIRPVDDLPPVGEQDPGHRHHEDDQPSHAAGSEMYPEQNSAGGHQEVPGLKLPPSAAAGCDRRR